MTQTPRPARIWPWFVLIVVMVMVVKTPETSAHLALKAAHGASEAATGISRFAESLGGGGDR